MSQKDTLMVGSSKIGLGVFANKEFKKGELILKFHGPLLAYEDLPKVYPEEDHYLQIGKKLYKGPAKDTEDFFNHSCDPNAGLLIEGEQIALIAIKIIQKNEEITFDYSSTMDEGGWEIHCACGSENCRKRIRDFKYLPEPIKEKYRDLGIVPDYLKGY